MITFKGSQHFFIPILSYIYYLIMGGWGVSKISAQLQRERGGPACIQKGFRSFCLAPSDGQINRLKATKEWINSLKINHCCLFFNLWQVKNSTQVLINSLKNEQLYFRDHQTNDRLFKRWNFWLTVVKFCCVVVVVHLSPSGWGEQYVKNSDILCLI